MTSLTLKEKNKIVADIADIRTHINVFNKETGELRDLVREIKEELGLKASTNAEHIACINVKMSQVMNDVDWLKRTYWIIAGASITGLAATLFNLVERLYGV